MASAPAATPQVDLDHVARLEKRLDQACRSDQHAIGPESDGEVAVLTRDEPPPGDLAAALGHTPRHRARRHRPGGASAWCTMAPPTSVSAARPVSARPANGVLRLLESSTAGCTFQRVVVSSTTTSAGAPGCSVPPDRRNVAAGALLMRAMSSGRVKTPLSTSSVWATPNAVSSPMIPNGASSKAASLASYAWGAWSEAMQSITPSLSPCRSAAMSAASRSGGVLFGVGCGGRAA